MDARIRGTTCDTSGADATLVEVPHRVITRLLELLDLSARRGAFDIEEFEKVGALYTEAVRCLQNNASLA